MSQVNELNRNAMTIRLEGPLPPYPTFVEGMRRAPDRGWTLNRQETELALRNALRYVPEEHHRELIPEFLEELRTRGRIYAYRFRPAGRIKGRPIEEYRGRCLAGKAFQVMIDNNLDFETALYPYELVTYGETGQVCQNWLQYRLIMKYLEELTEDTPSWSPADTRWGCSDPPPGASRDRDQRPAGGTVRQPRRLAQGHAAGVTNYGQMTAGGWMYIGPEGASCTAPSTAS